MIGLIIRQKISSAISLILLFCFSSPAHAKIHVATSLEWMTTAAPLIVRGVVTDVKTTSGIFSEQPLWVVQEVIINVKETLKGPTSPTIQMRWLNSQYESAEQWKTDGHEYLFFLTKGEKDFYGVDLTNDWVLYEGFPYLPIDLVNVNHPPAMANMHVPKDPQEIIKVVKKRLAREKEFQRPVVSNPETRVGLAYYASNGAVQLDVPENSEAYSVLFNGSACFLIVPADNEYKLDALQKIKSSDYWERVKGAQILSSYPGEESVLALKSLLNDSETHPEGQYSSNNTKRKYEKYGVREAAYQALQRLDVDVPRPVLEK